MRSVYNVTQINEYAQSLLNRDPILRSLFVEGEISGFKRYPSGHLYFSLKDESSSVSCMMFSFNAQALSFVPQDGMRVVLGGKASIYPKNGQFRIIAESMEQVGEGELYKRFLELKAKLEKEGLFSPQFKKALPVLPRCVGIVTSEAGAVYHDILDVARRRFPTMSFVLAPCAVQGIDAPAGIVRSLRALDESGLADVIIVGRGGGSALDLAAYNDEAVARAIFDCKTPVVSAVGHETDYSIADLVADMRAPTPSAAAELCVPLLADLEHELLSYRSTMESRCDFRLRTEKSHLAHCQSATSVRALKSHLNTLRSNLKLCALTHATRIEAASAGYCNALTLATERLAALSPSAVLKRGYAYITGAGGEVLSTVAAIKDAESLTLHVQDGTVNALAKK